MFLIQLPTVTHLDTTPISLAALLNSASLHAGGPIIDFSRLQKAVLNVVTPLGYHIENGKVTLARYMS